MAITPGGTEHTAHIICIFHLTPVILHLFFHPSEIVYSLNTPSEDKTGVVATCWPLCQWHTSLFSRRAEHEGAVSSLLAQPCKLTLKPTSFLFRIQMLCDYKHKIWPDLPVGRCTILTALSVLLTCCPPAPLALKVSMRKSLGFTLIST